MEEGIVPQSEYEKAAKYCMEEALPVAQFFTGVAGSSRSEVVSSVGHIFQGVIAGKCWRTLKAESEYFIEKGKIKQDFITSDQSQSCLIELLKFFEQEIPDQERFVLLKKIYIVTASEQIYNRESPLPLQFIQMAKKLTQGEILVLFAAQRLGGVGVASQSEFIELLTRESKLVHKEIVQRHYDSLFSNSYLAQVQNNALISQVLIRDYLITPMGKAFCDFVIHYDELQKD